MSEHSIIKFKSLNYLTWAVALAAMIISLILSEILKYPPCTLCWYQRVFMYPLVFIIPVGILLEDSRIYFYSLILGFVGLMIAIYHTLIYHGIIQEAFKLCNAELSCKTKQFELFNLISIPMMSSVTFLIIVILNSIGVFYEKKP
ncbi:MAG: disulfide bond formation protein B [Moraxellaceae bacterium]|nr:disulfide bond formation protein B [Pseudobdellovibrionaceae bacterium]